MESARGPAAGRDGYDPHRRGGRLAPEGEFGEDRYGPYLADLDELVLEPGPLGAPETFAGILLGVAPRVPFTATVLDGLEVEVQDVVTGRRRTVRSEGMFTLCAVPTPADIDTYVLSYMEPSWPSAG